MEKQALAHFVESMTAILSDAKGFVLDQAPEVVRQVIAYDIATSLLWVLFFVVLTAIGVWAVVKGRGHKNQDSVEATLAIVLGAITIVAGSVGIFACIERLLKVTLAPKVFLLEYFARLVQ